MTSKHRRLWVPLTVGFATVLALSTAATLGMLRKSFGIFDQLASAHGTHYRAADALMRLRSDLYLAGILKRDFLLDRGEGQRVAYGEQFAQIQASTEASLRTIEAAFIGHRAEIERLRAEVSAYMLPLGQALDWQAVAAASLRDRLLRTQVIQRTAALRIAAEIERLNADGLAHQQSQIAAAEDEFRRALTYISVLNLLFGVAVAASTAVYTRKLEHQSDEAQSELRRLSQHIVRVQEHERKSISRELHDEIGQMLTALRMELANADGPAVRQDPSEYERLQEAKRLAERSLQCVRNLSLLLRPSVLDDLGLSPALKWQAKEFSRRSGIPVDVSVVGDVDGVPEDLRTCVYRVTQEALTNVARHAHANRICIRVQRRDGHLDLAIEDDGAGFALNRPHPARGLGLIGMKERVAELSGIVDVDTAPGRGTRILATIPVQNGAAC